METIDEETLAVVAKDYSRRALGEAFCWWNATRMHSARTSKKPTWARVAKTIPDGMVEHDGQVGELLKRVGHPQRDITLVMY